MLRTSLARSKKSSRSVFPVARQAWPIRTDNVSQNRIHFDQDERLHFTTLYSVR